MESSGSVVDFFVKHFDAQKNSVASRALSKIRDEGISQFRVLGIPTKKEETWKYTPIKSYLEKKLDLLNQKKDADSSSDIEQTIKKHLLDSSVTFVFVDGQYYGCATNKNFIRGEVSKVDGIEFRQISELLEEKNLNQLLNIQSKDALAALNQAFFGKGAWIKIKKDSEVKQVIQTLFLSQSSLITPRNVIEVEKGACATLVENYGSVSKSNEGFYFNNSLTDIRVGEGASLEYVRVQQESLSSSHVGSTRITLERDSQIRSHAISLGGELTRHTLNVDIMGPGATAIVNGLYVTQGNQHCDNHTNISHFKEQGTSRQTYKGILADRSHAVFDGRIYVHQGAQKTDSQQLNKNLLLSKKAEVDTKPQLEINADDVKATHGATVGQMNPDELFYLETRCIDKQSAISLLAHGFAEDILLKIKSNDVRNHLSQILFQTLESINLEEVRDGIS